MPSYLAILMGSVSLIVVFAAIIFAFELFRRTSRSRSALEKLEEKNKLTIEDKKALEERYRLLTEELEKKVLERTEELEEKVIDLEKLNKFMVGRELKMIELKDEISQQSRKLSELREKVPIKKPKK